MNVTIKEKKIWNDREAAYCELTLENGAKFVGKASLQYHTNASGEAYYDAARQIENKYGRQEDASANPFDFGVAPLELRAGKKVARSGWNGKGMWLYLVPANSYPAQTQAAKDYWCLKNVDIKNGVPMVPYSAYIAMKTAQENVVPWLASQTDVLAEDWLVVA